MKYAVPRDCHRYSCVLSPSGRTQSGARHRRCFQRLPTEKASRGPQTQQHVSKHDEFSALRLIMMNSVIENGSRLPKMTEAHTLLKASLEKQQVEDGIFDQLLPVPTSSKFYVRVAKHM